MSGLCGWFGPDTGASSPSQALDDMAAALPGGPHPCRHGQAEPGRGLYLGGVESDCHVYTEGPVWAALLGNPHWQAADLAAVAEREGHGKALALAYGRRGKDLFTVLSGPCAIVVLDKAANRALLAIDRLGVRRICVTEAAGGLIFATTTDAICAHPAAPSVTLNPQALFDYLYFSRSPAPGTIYREHRKLIPAQYLWHEKGHSELAFFWRMPFEESDGRDIGALGTELRAVLLQAVRRAVGGRDMATVGAFLSGGLDSTTLVGMLSEISPDPVQAFTIGFDAEGYDETAYAREAARHFGADLHEYRVTPDDILALAPRLAEAYDEPFGNTSAVPSYYAARLAKEHGMALVLAGDGGNEIFAGNNRYAQQKVFAAYGLLPQWARQRLLEPLIFGIPGGASLPLIRKARSYIGRANIPMPARIETYNFYADIAPDHCFHPEIAAAIDRNHPARIIQEAYDRPVTRSMVNRMLNVDLQMTLADDDLRKVGRTCELAGISVRYPLLDEDVAAFSARVPAAVKLRRLHLRYFYRRAMRHFLPRISLVKPKHGFGSPFGLWLKTHRPLQEMAYDAIAALKGRDIFQPAYLDEAIDLHREGHASYHGEVVWVLMMLEMWLQAHRSPPRPRPAQPMVE